MKIHKFLSLIFSISIFVSGQTKDVDSKSTKQPNVLFISIDDLNDFPAFMGSYKGAITPNMDSLAKRGVYFTNAHTPYTLCGPARASIMTGFRPSTLDISWHVNDSEVIKRSKRLGGKAMHTYFSENGYKSMAVGKIFHHHVPKDSVDESGGREGFSQGTGKLKRNWPQKGTSTDWAMAPDKDSKLPDFKTAEWAVDQLKKKHDKPFLLMVGFLRPHVPWYVPPKWFELYDKNKINLPPYKEDDLDDVPKKGQNNIGSQFPSTDWAVKNNKWRDIIHAYLACTSFVDHQLGKVLDALDKSQYKDNTIIVLWSDHGYHLGEKGAFQKMTLWERSTNVPLIFAGPGIQKDKSCARTASLLDLYPTLVELCGLEKNSKNEGRSLAPLLTNPDLQWNYPVITSYAGNNFAVQTERYRYISYEDGSEELYDHQKDPNEWSNLAKSPETNELRQKLKTHLPKSRFSKFKKK